MRCTAWSPSVPKCLDVPREQSRGQLLSPFEWVNVRAPYNPTCGPERVSRRVHVRRWSTRLLSEERKRAARSSHWNGVSHVNLSNVDAKGLFQLFDETSLCNQNLRQVVKARTTEVCLVTRAIVVAVGEASDHRTRPSECRLSVGRRKELCRDAVVLASTHRWKRSRAGQPSILFNDHELSEVDRHGSTRAPPVEAHDSPGDFGRLPRSHGLL